MLATIVVIIQTVISFTTVAAGTHSGIDQPRQVVARTTSEWQALWKTHSPDAAPPSVDFTKATVVGVFLGSRPTAGFDVRITAVKQERGHVVVEYAERTPAPGVMLAQVLTSPFHLIRIPHDTGEIEFRKVAR